MATDTVEQPGVCGGLDEFLDKLNATKKIQPLAGKTPDGESSIDLPSWFYRTGLRRFEIDSGFGRVKCRLPRFEKPSEKVKVEEQEAVKEDELISLVCRSLVALPVTPKWVFEEATKLGGKQYEDGADLPSPGAFADADVDMQREYLSHFPRSVLGQIYMGLGLMALAPLPLDPTTGK